MGFKLDVWGIVGVWSPGSGAHRAWEVLVPSSGIASGMRSASSMGSWVFLWFMLTFWMSYLDPIPPNLSPHHHHHHWSQGCTWQCHTGPQTHFRMNRLVFVNSRSYDGNLRCAGVCSLFSALVHIYRYSWNWGWPKIRKTPSATDSSRLQDGKANVETALCFSMSSCCYYPISKAEHPDRCRAQVCGTLGGVLYYSAMLIDFLSSCEN